MVIDDNFIPAGVSNLVLLDPDIALSTRRYADGFAFSWQTEVYTSAWTVTHDPRYFHDPENFIPERWLDPNCTDVKEASQPFSLGTRGCLGRK